MGTQVLAKEYGIVPGRERETALRLRILLDKFRETENLTLTFEPGEYHFFPDYAKEILMFISNHDEDTIKRTAFDLTGYQNLRIEGKGAELIFHTDIVPFYCHKCTGLIIEDISIDYERPGYSQGEVVSVSPKDMQIKIDRKKYPYHIEGGRLYFDGENFSCELNHWMEYDPQRYGPICEGPDFLFNWGWHSPDAFFKEVDEEVVEMELRDKDVYFSRGSAPGNLIALRHHPRSHPAFYVTDSRDIQCRQVTVYHCVGMAFICQFTENILLERLNVIRHPAKKRVFTAAADGFHFVYCKGLIEIRDCLLENQLDDPLNIHGIYFRIHKVTGDREVIAQLVHHQQKGVRLGSPGDEISLVDRETMLRKGTSPLEEFEILNKDFCRVRFQKPIEGLKEMDVLENLSQTPDVLVEGCTFRNNRARGLLLTSGGNVTVRNNYFHVPGAAILISGDCNDWFESGAVGHVLVEGNFFDRCSYVKNWGKAPIQVSPSILKTSEKEKYHHCLEIRGNRFACIDQRILYAKNIKKLIFEGNEMTHAEGFPPLDGEAFVTEDVGEFIKDC